MRPGGLQAAGVSQNGTREPAPRERERERRKRNLVAGEGKKRNSGRFREGRSGGGRYVVGGPAQGVWSAGTVRTHRHTDTHTDTYAETTVSKDWPKMDWPKSAITDGATCTCGVHEEQSDPNHLT